jgi:hypothetical protein
MSNYLQVQLGGEKRGLKFNLGTLRHIGAITGQDPFAFAINIKEYSNFIEDLGTIIYAGLLSNCDSKKVAPDFSQEDARRWADELDNMSEALSIIAAFHNAFKVEVVSQEGNADTQLAATNVA